MALGLDALNAKGLFRRAKARTMQHEYQGAVDDLKVRVMDVCGPRACVRGLVCQWCGLACVCVRPFRLVFLAKTVK